MSSKIPRKTPRNGELKSNDKKKRSSEEIKNYVEENDKKHGEKEKETTSKTIGNVDWEEDKDTIRQFLREEYPLKTSEKIEEILTKKSLKYLDVKKYEKFFLRLQSKRLNEKMRRSKKLSEAPDSVKQYFDDEARETNYHSSDDDESNEDDDEEDYESESISDKEENEKENRNDVNVRKRTHENCNLEDVNENPLKKKDKPTMRWLPNGNKASN